MQKSNDGKKKRDLYYLLDAHKAPCVILLRQV